MLSHLRVEGRWVCPIVGVSSTRKDRGEENDLIPTSSQDQRNVPQLSRLFTRTRARTAAPRASPAWAEGLEPGKVSLTWEGDLSAGTAGGEPRLQFSVG